MLTVQEAFNNIINVVSNAKMTGPEHDALKESIGVIAKRCKVADDLETATKAGQESKKQKEEENGPTNEPTDIPGTNQEDS